ncbi:MAG: hypothetical protein GKR93_01340 [Gammaproteobacteria bacterium]|nr:hypothetical protein [Gammaproteobacteria bacterium]
MIIRSLVFTLLLFSLTNAAAVTDWNISGSNTLRASVYEVNGAANGSPYPFTGDMFFDELSLYFSKDDSEYKSWQGEITGLYNVNDDYRSQDFGLVPERINLTRENGESSLPFRAEVGDFFAYYSFLTSQRSLKGV